MIYVGHLCVRKALILLVLVLSGSTGLGLTTDDLLKRQIENRDSVASLRARVRWLETRTGKKDFKTEQIIKHDEFSRQYLTELCPDPNINASDFRLDALLRNPGYGFYYGHIYDGYSTLQLSFRAEGRDIAILDGPAASPLLRNARTPQSITMDIATSALFNAGSTPRIETSGNLTKVLIRTEASDLKLTFDASKGLMPTHIDIVQNGVSSQVTADYRKFGDVWFPVVGERVIKKKGETHLASFSVKSINVNQPLDDNEFEFHLKDGVKVIDSRFGSTWKYKANKSELGAPKPTRLPLANAPSSHWFTGISWLVGGVVFVASIWFVRGKRLLLPLTPKVVGCPSQQHTSR